ncbi:hypothetical protein BV898_01817 [Hypsibius exemplaris]|uniref:Uncharacterized protein n=1 Tax=Hypsibius exemplaris TaxID=2072580 RepID=A0A1W0X9S6_HYPEX|nr:hypothetical protein BV898_01817 [Hypsibius exemplaris]
MTSDEEDKSSSGSLSDHGSESGTPEKDDNIVAHYEARYKDRYTAEDGLMRMYLTREPPNSNPPVIFPWNPAPPYQRPPLSRPPAAHAPNESAAEDSRKRKREADDV